MPTLKHPLQPLHIADDGVLRYKKNQIVVKLLEVASKHGLDLNEINYQMAIGEFSQEDYTQLMMLIGFSFNGLPYMPDELRAASLQAYETGKTETEAHLEYCKNELRLLKKALRTPIARLYGKHPNDLLDERWEEKEEE